MTITMDIGISCYNRHTGVLCCFAHRDNVTLKRWYSETTGFTVGCLRCHKFLGTIFLYDNGTIGKRMSRKGTIGYHITSRS